MTVAAARDARWSSSISGYAICSAMVPMARAQAKPMANDDGR